MPSTWDAKADKDLLLSIIDDGQLKSINWPSIASKMKSKNYTFSHEACRQHFQKIRKESKTGSNPPTPNGKKTTTSTSANNKRKAAGSSKSAFFHTDNGNEFEEDDEEFAEFNTPSKKHKAGGVKKEEDLGQTASLFKLESMDSSDTTVIDLERDDLYDY